MKKKLLKDIVIPAGTIFEEAPLETIRTGKHFQHTFGLSKDTSGTLDMIYDVGEEEEREQLKEYFEDV